MGRLYQRRKGGIWYLDFETPEGKRVQRSSRTTDKAVAKERLRQAELAATPAARGRKQSLSDAIDHMIALLHDKAAGTVEMYQQKARRIEHTLGNPLVGQVTHDMLSEYIAKRLDKDDKVHGRATAHTVQKELITIRRALKIAHRRGILPALPSFPEFSAKYQPRETWLTPEQFGLVSAELELRRRIWASLAALAGANLSEVEGIDWTMVEFSKDPDWATSNLPAGRMLIPGTKRETRRRWVPIAPALRHVLEQVPQRDRRGKVAEHWGNVRRDLHLAVERANRNAVLRVVAWDRADAEKMAVYSYEKLVAIARSQDLEVPPAIPRVSPNDLRRTFASWLVQNDVPLLTVAALMGHSSTRMVERVYGKLSKRNFDEAIAALPPLMLHAPKHVHDAAYAKEPPALPEPQPKKRPRARRAPPKET